MNILRNNQSEKMSHVSEKNPMIHFVIAQAIILLDSTTHARHILLCAKFTIDGIWVGGPPSQYFGSPQILSFYQGQLIQFPQFHQLKFSSSLLIRLHKNHMDARVLICPLSLIVAIF